MDIGAILQKTRFLFQQLTFKVISTEKALPLLQSIEKNMNAIQMSDWPNIRIEYLAELSKLKWDLEYLLKEPNIRSNNGFLIGFRDRMKSRLFDGIDIINERKIVTNIFNEFIKGITFFVGETQFAKSEPLYHRDGSCPPRNMPNFTCINDVSDENIKKRVHTCYVERLIYDALWLQIMGSQQDGAHLGWLENTRNAFRTCFPNTNVSVSLRLSNGKPDNVAIIVETDSGTATELFEKAYFAVDEKYDDRITAIRIIDSNIVAVKTNTYQKEGTWKIMTSGGGKKNPMKILDAIVLSRKIL